ncbi:hypothetical protein PVAP13_1NG565100 [Panicum virgatum]|uniref:Uncharacterized protein n=1 Tax=Panicum virgatum TaxID=38727 RepID=A0A8T0X457_PANVG|nr:hypothetical protein PVAP13_1NG565100 [Panicum virgatum]
MSTWGRWSWTGIRGGAQRRRARQQAIEYTGTGAVQLGHERQLGHAMRRGRLPSTRYMIHPPVGWINRYIGLAAPTATRRLHTYTWHCAIYYLWCVCEAGWTSHQG